MGNPDHMTVLRKIEQLKDKWLGQQEQLEELRQKDRRHDELFSQLLESQREVRTEIERLQSQVSFLQHDYRQRKAEESQRPYTCGQCGEEGHNRLTCPELQACGNCGVKGHKRPTCPELQACGNCGMKGHKRPTCPALVEA